MMKHEFEELAGRTVTNEQYKAIETLYMESNLTKPEFVKSIKQMLKSIPEVITKSPERIALEERINAEIKELKESIEWSELKLNSYKTYYEDDIQNNRADARIWKHHIKSEKEWIRHCKNRISALEWVVS